MENQEDDYEDANRAGVPVAPGVQNPNTDHARMAEGMPNNAESPRFQNEVAIEGKADDMMNQSLQAHLQNMNLLASADNCDNMMGQMPDDLGA